MTFWFFEKCAVFIGAWAVLYIWTEWDRNRLDRKDRRRGR